MSKLDAALSGMGLVELMDAQCECCEAGKTIGAERVKSWHAFRETLDFFRKVYDRDVVLAGGAIRDMYIDGPSLISDYDVFVMGVKETDIPVLDEKAHAASKRLHEMCREAETISYGGGPKQKFHIPKTTWKLPFVPGAKPVQIMYSPRENMRDLVSHFDWRVCSFGFDGETVITDGVEDFRQHRLSLNLDNRLPSPKSTLSRGFRISTKFARGSHFLVLPNELILALASMLVLNGESSPEEDKPQRRAS